MTSIIRHSITLVVCTILYTSFERNSSPSKLRKFVVKRLIHCTSINQFVGIFLPVSIFRIEEVNTCLALNNFEQSINQLIIASYRNALILVVEVVVIEDYANRQTLDDKCLQLLTVMSPLLFCILLDELVENVFTNKAKGLFF